MNELMMHQIKQQLRQCQESESTQVQHIRTKPRNKSSFVTKMIKKLTRTNRFRKIDRT